MKIGMIVAIREEMDALFRTCGTPLGIDETAGYKIYSYKLGNNTVYVAGSGVGEIASAGTTQYLITKYGVDLLVNFGVCGGLTEDMGLQRTVVVEKAVHYDYDASPFYGGSPAQYPDYSDIYIAADTELIKLAQQVEPSLKPVTCASADKFVENIDIKKKLHEAYNADICEMEAAGILLTAHRNKVPALLIKGVSDSVSGDAAEFAAMVHESAEICLKVLLCVLNMLK